MGEDRDWFNEFIRVTSPKLDMQRAIEASLSSFVTRNSRPGADLMGRHSRTPRLNPTKGYRGAHKLFRGGSR